MLCRCRYLFYVDLINCIARLCAGRYRRAIDYFLSSDVAVCPSLAEKGKRRRYFSYSNLMELVRDGSKKIPWAVKDRLLLLVQVFFIDREPYEHFTLCQFTRVWPAVDIGSLVMPQLEAAVIDTYIQHNNSKQIAHDVANGIIPFDEPKPGFADVKDLILVHLKTWMSHQSEDIMRTTLIEFTNTLLRVLFLLISFGTYEVDEDVLSVKHDGTIGLTPELIEIVALLVPLLATHRSDDDFKLGVLVKMKATALDVIDSAVQLKFSSQIDTAMALLLELNAGGKEAGKKGDTVYHNPLSAAGDVVETVARIPTPKECEHIVDELLKVSFSQHDDELTKIFVTNLQHIGTVDAVFATVESLITMKMARLKLVSFCLPLSEILTGWAVHADDY